MSVKPLLLYVIQMPSVQTFLAAMSVIVTKATLETEHHAPVSTDGIRHSFTSIWHSQISMSVKLVLTVVMRMQTVSIMRGVTLVYASLDTLEMDFPVLVRHPHQSELHL